jgi:hypothetical protein
MQHDQYHILTKVLIIVWYLFLVSPYSTVTKQSKLTTLTIAVITSKYNYDIKMEYRTKSTRQDLQRKYNNETMNLIQQKALSKM